MNKVNLQVGMVVGQYVDKIDLLVVDDLCQLLVVFVGQYVQVVVCQFIIENIGFVGSVQNIDFYWGRSYNFVVELFVFFQVLGVIFCGDKNVLFIYLCQCEQYCVVEDIKNDSIDDQYMDLFQYLIY